MTGGFSPHLQSARLKPDAIAADILLKSISILALRRRILQRQVTSRMHRRKLRNERV